LFDVPSVGEDFTIGGLQLVGAWLEHFSDNERPLARWGELVAILVALDKA
jgi:hypothetical protein